VTGELSLSHKRRLSDYPNRRVRERAESLLEKGGEAINSDRQQVLAEFSDLAAAMGDATNGKAVFTKNCATCHKFRGEGATLAPDLTGMAALGKEQLLVHVLDPSRDIEGNYHSYTLLLNDGRVLSGMLAGESATSIELVDAEAKRHAILREDIDELTRSVKSVMPEGFEKQLSRAELSDLLEFLAERTQFVPLDLRRAATISSAESLFGRRDSGRGQLAFEDWGAKEFAGVPFYPIDPQDGRTTNLIMLRGGRRFPQSDSPLPRTVDVPCRVPAKAIHFLSGVSWGGYPMSRNESVSMVVRLRYADGETEEHSLLNGVHFASIMGGTDVTGSQQAFVLGEQQLRYFKIEPKRDQTIDTVELLKGEDQTAPVVMAITAERR
jgi:putative heme-binding domain-containing protein